MPNSARDAAISQLEFSKLIPNPTDRALLVGQTGSGKTTLARYLLNHRKHRVVLDYKGLINWPEYKRTTKLKELVKSKESALLYVPSYDESQDEEVADKLWEWLFRRGGTTIYVDETAAITNGNVYPYHYGACLMRGREKGIELWSATQRPTRIPTVVLSESENVYAFKLRMPQDRERVEQLTGVTRDSISALKKREFLFSRQDGETVGPITLKL